MILRTIIITGAVVLVLVLVWLGYGQYTNSMRNPAASLTKAGILNLIGECQKLASDGAAQGKETWMANDSLPPTIKSLSPQLVRLEPTGLPYTVVINIQISGGFEHQGYLIVCSSEDPKFIPQIGRDWKIIQIAPSVFQYQE